MEKKTCVACSRELKPNTSVPRWDASTVEMHRKFYEEMVAKRKAEIETGTVGYLGEGHFCGQPCAAYFGRASYLLLESTPQQYSMLLIAIQRLLKRYGWIANRIKGK